MFGSALLQRRSWVGTCPSVGHSGLMCGALLLEMASSRSMVVGQHDVDCGLAFAVRSPLRVVFAASDLWSLVGWTARIMCAPAGWNPTEAGCLLWRTDVVCSLVMLLSALQSNGCGQRSVWCVSLCPSSGGGARRLGRWVSLLWDWHWLRQGWKVRVTLLSWWHWPLTGSWISENIV
jgi:hypothetical protein